MTAARALTRWTRWPLWLFAAALLLKAAMPLLAGTAAEMQGKATFEICSVHGIPMEAAGSTPQAPGSDHSLPHPAEHCSLTALGAFATGDLPAPAPAPVVAASCKAQRCGAKASLPAHDACAVWVAQLHHGPPLLF